MNLGIRLCFLLLLCFSTSGFAEALPENTTYWQCTARDSLSRKWIARSIYEKMAHNLAYATCKKQSTTPASCKATRGNCEQFVMGERIQTMWRCTALDRAAMPWRSDFYSQRYDAAFAARDYCRQKSTVPGTCYINLVTCTKNEGIGR